MDEREIIDIVFTDDNKTMLIKTIVGAHDDVVYNYDRQPYNYNKKQYSYCGYTIGRGKKLYNFIHLPDCSRAGIYYALKIEGLELPRPRQMNHYTEITIRFEKGEEERQ